MFWLFTGISQKNKLVKSYCFYKHYNSSTVDDEQKEIKSNLGTYVVVIALIYWLVSSFSVGEQDLNKNNKALNKSPIKKERLHRD